MAELTPDQIVDLLEWAAEHPCDMEADDSEDYDPRVCSPHHTGRCWPCHAKVLLSKKEQDNG